VKSIALTFQTMGRLIAGALLTLLLCSFPARANLIASLQPVTLSPKAGDVGDALEVILSNTGAAVDIAAFNFDILTTDTAITFTDATTATVLDPYIFNGNSLFGPDIVNPGFAPGQEISASDLASAPGTFTMLGTGGVVSLGEVFYDVASNAPPGPFTVSFNQGNTDLSDQALNGIPITTFQSANITIAAAAPEPSSVALLLGGAALLAGLAGRKRK